MKYKGRRKSVEETKVYGSKEDKNQGGTSSAAKQSVMKGREEGI